MQLHPTVHQLQTLNPRITSFSFSEPFKMQTNLSVDPIVSNVQTRGALNARRATSLTMMLVSGAIVGVPCAKDLINVQNAKWD